MRGVIRVSNNYFRYRIYDNIVFFIETKKYGDDRLDYLAIKYGAYLGDIKTIYYENTGSPVSIPKIEFKKMLHHDRSAKVLEDIIS